MAFATTIFRGLCELRGANPRAAGLYYDGEIYELLYCAPSSQGSASARRLFCSRAGGGADLAHSGMKSRGGCGALDKRGGVDFYRGGWSWAARLARSSEKFGTNKR